MTDKGQQVDKNWRQKNSGLMAEKYALNASKIGKIW